MFKRNIATKEDLKFGLQNEIPTKTKIEKYFKCILNQLDKYNKMDFVDSLLNMYFELKTRRIKMSMYETTFINNHKIEEANRLLDLDKDCKIYFIFSFLDNLAYIRYNKDLFNTFKIKDTYLPHRKCYLKNYEIPIKKLIKINL